MTQSYNLSQLANNLNSSGQLDATDGLIGALPVANGGTALAAYTVGDILYASGTTSLSKLADVATGNALISGGVSTAPMYGKIELTTHISGTLPISNGGTGTTTLAANNVLLGNGTSTFQTVAPGTSGNVLTSDGSTWSSAVNVNFGFGQTWQDLTTSRASSTNYTNSTGKPIMIVVTISVTGSGANVTFIVDSVTIPFSNFSAQSGQGYAGGTIIVPAGAVYSVSSSPINSWLELR